MPRTPVPRVALGVLLAAALLGSAGCGPEPSRRLADHTLPAGVLGREMPFTVLAAPGEGPAPVVYVLHGLFDDQRSLDRYGLAERFHQEMAAGRLPRAHLIMPYGERGFWTNWYDGSARYEDYLLAELMPRAEALLGVTPGREGRHLVGVSMGGLGALNLALRHPDRFASATVLSALILDEDEARAWVHESIWTRLLGMQRIFGDGHDDAFMKAHNPFAIVRGRGTLGFALTLAAGRDEDEEVVETTARFHAFLEERKLAHDYEVYAGEHAWSDWGPVIERALARHLGRQESPLPAP